MPLREKSDGAENDDAIIQALENGKVELGHLGLGIARCCHLLCSDCHRMSAEQRGDLNEVWADVESAMEDSGKQGFDADSLPPELAGKLKETRLGIYKGVVKEHNRVAVSPEILDEILSRFPRINSFGLNGGEVGNNRDAIKLLTEKVKKHKNQIGCFVFTTNGASIHKGFLKNKGLFERLKALSETQKPPATIRITVSNDEMHDREFAQIAKSQDVEAYKKSIGETLMQLAQEYDIKVGFLKAGTFGQEAEGQDWKEGDYQRVGLSLDNVDKNNAKFEQGKGKPQFEVYIHGYQTVEEFRKQPLYTPPGVVKDSDKIKMSFSQTQDGVVLNRLYVNEKGNVHTHYPLTYEVADGAVCADGNKYTHGNILEESLVDILKKHGDVVSQEKGAEKS